MSTVTTLESQVRERISTLSYLPTTVAVAMKFMELGKDPEAEPDDYAKVISSDPSLSSKLLALANSSWFGVRNRVTRPKVAINLLGLGTVRTLAMSYCLTGLHHELRLSAEESREFWSAALCKAVAARTYAMRFNEKQAEEAFTIGLLEDFAQPIMFAYAREPMLAILNDATLDTTQRCSRERELFHLDHTELGRVLAQKLELPELFVDAIAFHHQRANLTALLPQQVLTDAAEVAALFPHRLNVWNPTDGAALRAFLQASCPQRPITDQEFLTTVQDEFNRLYAYFEPGDRPALKLVELLEQAARSAADATTHLVGTVQDLMTQAASAGKEVHRLIRAQDHLQETADHDSLTGALSRQGFMVRAGEALTNARRYRTSLALIYLDIDAFKSINDNFGHAAGDAALQTVVTAAQAGVRQMDLVGRLGGDEFVLLLADTSQDQALAVAQRIMAQISAQCPPQIDSARCHLTLSAGLSWVGQNDPAPDLDEWLRAADQLMYAAKHAGGNNVKVQSGLAAAP